MNDLVKHEGSFTQDQLALITNTVAKGATELELQLFLHQCARTGLDPLSNQIYCIKRRASDGRGGWTEKATIQAGIDGLRLIADRTGRYAPGDPPQYSYDQKGQLLSARVGIWKNVGDKWFQVWGEAFWKEYVQTTRDGQPTAMWKSKPHIMLGKCAESAALRRGFPAELSGIYSNEEMAQADNPTVFHVPEEAPEKAAHANAIDAEAVTHKDVHPIDAAFDTMAVPDAARATLYDGALEQAHGDKALAAAEIAGWARDGYKWNEQSGTIVPKK
jgi:phage recombination protein Bet